MCLRIDQQKSVDVGKNLETNATYESKHIHKAGQRADDERIPPAVRLIHKGVDSVPSEGRNCDIGNIAESKLVISKEHQLASKKQSNYGTYSCVFFSSSLKTCLST